MATRYDASISTPQDEDERERLAAVGPTSWINPVPEAPYQLVILGGGSAGLAAADAAATLG
ncbi:MAG: FAD-containing oxidoreductase, partial [Rhodanobacter sp.]